MYPRRRARLTPRELQVLRGVARGERSRDIASVLGIAPDTVRTHVQNALMKLRVHSRSEAVWIMRKELEAMDELKNDKYVVFKREDWDRWMKELVEGSGSATFEWLKDAVVIRLQDVFAGPGLYAYSHAIQTFIDAIDFSEDWYAAMHSAKPDIEKLVALRDFFAEQAQLATEHPGKKIPD